MIRKSLSVGLVALFAVAISGCWSSAKPSAKVEKPKKTPEQQVQNATIVEGIE